MNDWHKARSNNNNNNNNPNHNPNNLNLNVSYPPPSASSNSNHNNHKMQYTPKGSLFVDGMQIGVGVDGIIFPNRPAGQRYEKLPMRERLIILCKLGSGASSAVYKALDLTDMKLVALKTIHVLDK